ncbi:MAG: GAF domain-containing protein [Desulfobacteraceae bacterium]|nr:GAF domain-containing protein [Desulfobacteraceae bacterium]
MENIKSPTVKVAVLKIIVPLWITFFLFLLSLFFIFIPSLKTHMMDQKKEMIHGLTDSAWSLLLDYHHRVERSELFLADAQSRAKERIKELRYGSDGKDYFWISDLHPRMIMHPYVPGLDGTDLSTYANSQGRFMFTESAALVKEKGEGYLTYLWQWQDDPERIAEKLSYVKGFFPWGWVLGTGMYLDDVNSEIRVITHRLIEIFMGLLIIVLGFSFYITWQTVKNEKKRALAETGLRLEEQRLQKILELSQMSHASLEELTTFAIDQATVLTQSDIGYLFFMNDDETEMTVQNWSSNVMDLCELVDKPMVFPVKASGLWGEAIRKREAVITNDYKCPGSGRAKGYPRGHVDIVRHLNIPVFDGDAIVAVAGVANKRDRYNDSDVRQLQLLMDGMWKIIQRHRSEKALMESEQRYRLLADNATDCIWVLELFSRRLLYMSPSVKQMLGHTPEEFVRLESRDYLTEASLTYISMELDRELALEEKGGVDPDRVIVLELEHIKKDGATVWTETSARFLRDDQGCADRILGITRNITGRRQMEQRLKHSQKMEAVGTLAGGIAHDFNNILSSVLGFAELAKMGNEDDTELQDNLDQILAAGIRARDLVKHILTFSRQSDIQKSPMILAPLVKGCLQSVRATLPKDIDLIQRLEKTEATVMANASQLHQIIMNLCSNAVHAMKNSGGTIEIGLEAVAIEDPAIARAKGIVLGTYLELSVADTGTGMSSQVLGKIFDPFFTTKKRREATGMGLSTVYGIVREMEGNVLVSSEPGRGTTFQVFLPVCGAKPAGPVQSPALSKQVKARILWVDDEEVIIRSGRQCLESLAYKITGATDPLYALGLFRSYPGKFDLVVCDMAMPGINGLELSKRLLKIRPDIPIVLCTGFSQGLTSTMVKESGIVDLVMKPIIADKLVEVIASALNQNSGRVLNGQNLNH